MRSLLNEFGSAVLEIVAIGTCITLLKMVFEFAGTAFDALIKVLL